MKVFNISPKDYNSSYEENGYIHIPKAINEEFLNHVTASMEAQERKHKDMPEWQFKGKKRQYLYDFPEENTLQEIMDFLAEMAGLPESKMMLCERHLKVYESDAKPWVPAHKDRLQAELTVGFPLRIPEKSCVIAYPDNELTVNPYSSTAEWRDHLDEEELPENKLKDIEPLRIYAKPGDLVAFRGNSIYHEREYPADAALLYLKFNAMRLDPIGEDPRTHAQRQKSLDILETASDETLMNCKLEVSPRLDKISRYYSRLYWKEVLHANLWGEKEFVISEDEFNIFKKIDEGRTVDNVLQHMGIPYSERNNFLPAVKRLVKHGGIDLLG